MDNTSFEQSRRRAEDEIGRPLDIAVQEVEARACHPCIDRVLIA